MGLCGQSPQDHAWEQLQDLLVLGDDHFGHTDKLCAGTTGEKDSFAQELQQYLAQCPIFFLHEEGKVIEILVDFIKHKCAS